MAHREEGDGMALRGEAGDYPVPVSPLPPPHSNDIERRRADRAEAFFRELECGLLSRTMAEEELLPRAAAVRAAGEESANSDPASQIRPEVGTKRLASHPGDSGFNISTRFPQILYEDDAILVLNKPPGLYCHHTAELVEKFLRQRDAKLQESRRVECTPTAQTLTMAHRLDRDTSGVMLFAKTPEAATGLGREFARHTPRKTYIALGTLQNGGTLPAWKHTRVRTGHGRSRHGLWRVYRSEDVGRGLPGGNKVKDMETDIEILSTRTAHDTASFAVDSHTRGPPTKSSITGEDGTNPPGTAGTSQSTFQDNDGCLVFLRASPRTGRTHQIRLHCQFLGIPLVGDVKYGGATGRLGSSPTAWPELAGQALQATGLPVEPGLNWRELAGHALHADKIEIKHPLTGEDMLLQAPRPAWCPSML